MTISKDLWTRALDESGFGKDAYPDAVTTNELMVAWGLGRTATRARLQRLVTEGLAVVVRKHLVDSTGRAQPQTAYQLTNKKTSKGTKV